MRSWDIKIDRSDGKIELKKITLSDLKNTLKVIKDQNNKKIKRWAIPVSTLTIKHVLLNTCKLNKISSITITKNKVKIGV